MRNLLSRTYRHWLPALLLLLCHSGSRAQILDSMSLYFAAGKSNTDAGALRQVTQFVKQYVAGDSLWVTGYADEPGSRSDNNTLSLKRAMAARQLLVQAGIGPALINCSGKGVLHTATGENPQDRRVDILLRKPCRTDPNVSSCIAWCTFNSPAAAPCDLRQLLAMSQQLDLESSMTLNLVTYRLCPICRTDGTVPAFYQPLIEEEQLPEQRRLAIGQYLSERGIDPLQLRLGSEEKICLKGQNMSDTVLIRSLLNGQRKVSAYLGR